MTPPDRDPLAPCDYALALLIFTMMGAGLLFTFWLVLELARVEPMPGTGPNGRGLPAAQ